MHGSEGIPLLCGGLAGGRRQISAKATRQDPADIWTKASIQKGRTEQLLRTLGCSLKGEDEPAHYSCNAEGRNRLQLEVRVEEARWRIGRQKKSLMMEGWERSIQAKRDGQIAMKK